MKIIAVVSQKGGVGKSTLCRTIARELAANNWHVLIADMDISQTTSTEWNNYRNECGIEPEIHVQQFRAVENVLRLKDTYDIIIFDGAPHSTKQTLEIVKASNFSVLPTGFSKDDQNPQIRLAHDLIKGGVDKGNFGFAFCRIGSSESQAQSARDYLGSTGYKILNGGIPEKDGYRLAIDEGKSLTETPYKSLNTKADELIQSVFDNSKL